MYMDQDSNLLEQFGLNDLQSVIHSEVELRNEVIFKNGAVYHGQWLGNEKHGYGVQNWPDGARYEGMWKNNKASG